MKYIIKNPEPPSFTAWKITNEVRIQRFYADGDSKGVWKYFTNKPSIKKDIRTALVEEQGYICAYCNREIHNENLDLTEDIDIIDTRLTIEHIAPKSTAIGENALNYNNLVATCEGGEKVNATALGTISIPTNRPYCDKKKLNGYLDLHPLMKECESEIIFSIDGNISGLTDRAKDAIEILGLTYFNELRQIEIVNLLFEDSYEEIPTQLISKEDAIKIFENYISLENGKYKSYCSAICYVLKNEFGF